MNPNTEMQLATTLKAIEKYYSLLSDKILKEENPMVVMNKEHIQGLINPKVSKSI